jgi:hypothetical protein
VIWFNNHGPDRLIKHPIAGVPPSLVPRTGRLARIVEEGPIPPVHGVVRWLARGLIMLFCEELSIAVSDDTSILNS